MGLEKHVLTQLGSICASDAITQRGRNGFTMEAEVSVSAKNGWIHSKRFLKIWGSVPRGLRLIGLIIRWAIALIIAGGRLGRSKLKIHALPFLLPFEARRNHLWNGLVNLRFANKPCTTGYSR